MKFVEYFTLHFLYYSIWVLHYLYIKETTSQYILLINIWRNLLLLGSLKSNYPLLPFIHIFQAKVIHNFSIAFF